MNLFIAFLSDMTKDFCADKMETFLTCRAVCSYLKTKLVDNSQAKFLEEVSLNEVLKSLDEMSLADAQLLIRDLPDILSLPYPVVKELRSEILQRIPKLMYV